MRGYRFTMDAYGVQGETRTRTLFRALVPKTSVATVSPPTHLVREMRFARIYSFECHLLKMVCILFHHSRLFGEVYRYRTYPARRHLIYSQSIVFRCITPHKKTPSMGSICLVMYSFLKLLNNTPIRE